MSDKITAADLGVPAIIDAQKELNKYIDGLQLLNLTYQEIIIKTAEAVNGIKQWDSKALKQYGDGVKVVESANRELLKTEQLLIESKKKSEQLKQEEIKTQNLIIAQKQKEEQQQIKDNKLKEKAIINARDLTKQLRAMQKELIAVGKESGTGSDKFIKLAREAGELKSQISDAKNATKAFASESKAQTAGTLFGQVGHDLANLNFPGAADKAKQFAGVVSSITFKDVTTGIKQFGSTLFSLGKAILTNPLTIIAGIVIGIIAAFAKLKDSAGIIGDAFNKISSLVTGAIDALKAFSDQLGLTSFKSEENLNRVIDANKELIKQIEKRYKREIDLAKAVGKDVTNLEQKKEREVIIALRKQQVAVEDLIKTKRKGSDEEKDLEIQRRELTDEILDRANRIKILELERAKVRRRVTLEQIDNVKTLFRIEQKVDEQRLANYKKTNDEIQKESDKLAKELETTLLNNGVKEEEISNTLRDAKIDNLKAEIALEETSLIDATDKKLELARLEYNKKKDISDQEIADAKKRRDEIAKIESQILQGISDGLEKRNDAKQAATDKEIESTKTAIDRQRELAAQGQANELAFQEEQLAKEELAKKESLKRQQQQEEAVKLAQTFINDLNSRLANNEKYSDASRQAFQDTFITKGISALIAGSFAEGVENFKGKGTGKSDSNLIRFSRGESVVTADATQEYSGLVTALNNGNFETEYLPKYLAENGISMASSNQGLSISVVANKLDATNSLLKQLVAKPENMTYLKGFHSVVDESRKNGVKEVIETIYSRPRI